MSVGSNRMEGFCSQHPRARLPCPHCRSQEGRRSSSSKATQEQIANNERVQDDKKRRDAVSRRIRQTLPSNAAFMKNNDTTTVIYVLKHGDKTRKRLEKIVEIDDKCPEDVQDTLNQLFGDDGHVDKALRRAYRRSNGEEESEHDEEEDDEDIFADVNPYQHEEEIGEEIFAAEGGAETEGGGQGVDFGDNDE